MTVIQRTLWHNVRIATLDEACPAPYGALEQHVLVTEDDVIRDILPASAVDPDHFDGEVIDGGRGWLTPGLIDCHTHLVYGGNRAAEWEQRLNGVPYADIARAGGGIAATVRATRALDEEELALASLGRLKALMAEGVTTVEIKSGYGLSLLDEMKQLGAARRLGAALPVEVASTLLAAHAVPEEYRTDPDAFVDDVVARILPAVAESGLAEAVDVFCERIAFDVAQCDRILTAARALGFGVKGHVEQLGLSGGAVLLAGHGAWSCDHLEYLDEAGVAALAASGSVAVLLPGAFYFLRETRKPPVDALRRAGVPLAVASDLNPGTSPFASLRLAMNQACVLFGLTPEEALAGVTRYAARALGRAATHGRLARGCVADILLWDIAHPAEIAYSPGANPLVRRVWRGRTH